jgi:hypothetical protein
LRQEIFSERSAEDYINNNFEGTKITGPHLHLEIIHGGAPLQRTAGLGLWSSDLQYRANPDTFDINRPDFPYLRSGSPPRPDMMPAAPSARPPVRLSPPPPEMPQSPVGPPLDIRPKLSKPQTPNSQGVRPDPTGQLYFDPPSPSRPFGPFTWPDAGNSRTDRLGPQNGYGGGPGMARQSIDGDAADQTGNDSDGVWTTARQYMAGQTGRMTPPAPPTYDAPRALPVNGPQPIDTIGKAGLTGTQPVSPVQNLTMQTLRMKGVPEADIGAAINDPVRMQQLLNQLYGGRSAIAPGSGGSSFGRTVGRDITTGQPDQTSMPTRTPDNYLRFGWSGLPPLRR